MKSVTTLKFTSASRNARRTSLSPSRTLSAVSRPRPRSFLNASPSERVMPSNMRNHQRKARRCQRIVTLRQTRARFNRTGKALNLAGYTVQRRAADQRSKTQIQTKRSKGEMMRTLIASVLLVLAVPSLQADDWPQFLGPQRDGVWREDGILDKFPAGGPKQVWKQTCG